MTERRLRVAIDGTPLLGQRSGVGEMTAGLLEALAARDDVDPVAYLVTRHGRRELPPLLPPGVRAGTSPVPARLAHACWRHAAFPPIEVWTGRGTDVVHATNYVAPPSRSPTVVSVHDLTFLHFPELCTEPVRRYPQAIRRALSRGAVVHADSEFVAGEVREAFALPAERVVTVHLGLRARGGGDATAGRGYVGSDRYLLALSTIEPRKNLPTLVRAFDAIAGEHDDLRLAVAGGSGWDAGAFDRAVTEARHRDRVVRLGYVGDAERLDLLAGATLFAYPSIYEGFGLPPLEAMAAGVPVVASTAGSLPEVLGDAALLLEPGDTDAWSAALAELVDDGDARDELAARGRARAAGFTWPRAAGGLVALYGQIAGAR